MLNFLHSCCENALPFSVPFAALVSLFFLFALYHPRAPSLSRPLVKWGPTKPSDSLSVPSCHLDLFWAYFLFLSPAFPNHLCCLHQSGPLSPVLSFLPWVSLPHLPLLPFLSFNLSLNLPSSPHLSTLLLYDFLVVSTSEFSVSLCLNAS